MSEYVKQDRGTLSEYEEYFAGMDASMQQKIALTTAHFPIRGRVADMGSGSGSGTFDLARLYGHLQLVGVDINPVTVEYSNKHYCAENLEYTVGDIAQKVFAENSLDGILDSSVLHHVTSFNGFSREAAFGAISNQVDQLKLGGVLIIRDFVVPENAGKLVNLDLPTTDGQSAGEVDELSTAALFEVFARDFRSSQNLESGVDYKKFVAPRAGFARFQTTLKNAAEFVLRKDYRDHWAPELLEEYTYFSQSEFEHHFRTLDLRIVVSMPLWNPWIVENRFRGKFFLEDAEGRPLNFPPTNYLIVGEKVTQKSGVRIIECGGDDYEPSFLKLTAYRHRTTNQIYELALRPNPTVDLLPWFENETGRVFVLAKKDFPRPLVNAQRHRGNLSQTSYSGYLTEPISAIWDLGFGIWDLAESELRSKIVEILNDRAAVSKDEVLEISEPQFYFPSAGGIDERVESFLVEIKDWQKQPQEIENYTKFASAGTVRELDALQVLRASHVGGMFDARLEINIYRLLRRLERSCGAWIGADIKPSVQNLNLTVERSFEIEREAVFEPVGQPENQFLEICWSEFIEYDSTGDHLARVNFEYVIPRRLSRHTVTAIPFVKTAEDILVGVEMRDLPAVQRFTGSSRLPCVPAWRLPFEVKHKFDLEPFLREKFPADFKVSLKRVWELGGSYFTSPGVTPELVYPQAVELDAESFGKTDLKFYRLADLLNQTERIEDAHLLVALNRLAHALGV